MALIKYGGGVSSMSGKQGGSVHARNRAGAYIRNWAKPTNAPTDVQTARRATFANQSAGWSGLDPDDRAAWGAWANSLTMLNRQGDEYIPTGRQMYMSLNNNLAIIGADPIDLPPTGATPPTINPGSEILAEQTDGELTIMRLRFGYVVAGEFFIIQAAPVQTGGKHNLATMYRQIITGPSAHPFPCGDDYIARFGPTTPVGGVMKLKYRTVDEATGLSSPWLIVEGFVG